jgi:1-acyl-sn-glycerol-3-phosphate acyltransferase
VLALFAAAYWVFGVLVMAPLFAAALAVHVLSWPFDRRRVALHLLTCFWGSFYVWCNPVWHCRVGGRDKLPWRGAAVLVANHASLIDILVLFLIFRPFKWVSKAELGRVPFVGWMLWLNDYVMVRRGDRESIRRMLDHCRRHLAAGSPLLLFPEGTRTRTGQLGPFKEGGFRLALEAGVPVIPIAVHGTYEALPKSGILFNRMNARIEVLDPLDPAALGSAEALRDAARSAIAGALGERPAAPGAASPGEVAVQPTGGPEVEPLTTTREAR